MTPTNNCNIGIVFLSSSSAAFEWQNELAYYTGLEYNVYLNGQSVYKGNTNVFSLFGLIPDTTYVLTADILEGELIFRTESERAALSVRDFGARGDGLNDDTQAIQTAINCLPRGARLVFPAGTYLTAPICLKSHITLEITEGATLLGNTDKTKYPIIPGEVPNLFGEETMCFGTWEGNAVKMYQSLLFAEYAEDITIVGPGCVDGNAQNSRWWAERKTDPVGRPRLLFFNRCDGIRVHGIHAQNSASWHFHPYFSTNVDFVALTVKAPKDSPNTDAIDPEACDRVNIIGCRLSVGDDCIAVKSGKIEIGRRFKQPANRHVIRNCLMQFGHGAVTLGSEMAGGVKNLKVHRCFFENTDRGLRIKTRRGRGKDAVIDGIVFENLRMRGVKTPIVMNMWYNCCDPDRDSEYVWSRERFPVDDRTPYLGNFTFRNMECFDCEVAACYCDGLPEMPINSITLENIHFTYSGNAKPGMPAMRAFLPEMLRCGMYFDNVTELKLRNVHVSGAIGDALIIKNVGHLDKDEME